MKRLWMMLLLLLIMVWFEGNIDNLELCTAGNEEENASCNNFKSFNFLKQNIVYDLGFYDDNTEWIDVFYQDPIFYQQLKPFVDNDYLTFMTEDALDAGKTVDIKVTYNDGANQTQEKLLFVEIRDSSKLLNEAGDPINVVRGGFTYEIDDITFTIDTHSTSKYVYHRAGGDGFMEQLKIYDILLGASGGHDVTDDISIEFDFIDVGVKIFIYQTVLDKKEEIDVYYVLHNDFIEDSSYLIEPIIVETVVERLSVDSAFTYDITDMYVDETSQNIIVLIKVSYDDDVIHEETVELSDSNSVYELSSTLFDYTMTFNRYASDRVAIDVYNAYYSAQYIFFF